MNTRICAIVALLTLQLTFTPSRLCAQQWPWPPMLRESRPYTRWWWLGSAVDTAGITRQLQEFARVGIGGVEITPIYGVVGNEANELPYLSDEWMRMLRHTETVAQRLDMEVSMSTGTGWPFGGPWVTADEAACKVDVKDGRIVVGRTGQRVKRAAPGGEGFVVDHFDRDAIRSYLAAFETAFTRTRTPRPHTFFNDSYEVYGADWTPTFLDEFARRRGYRIEPFLIAAGDGDMPADVRSDYRETLGELLLENFTTQWTQWAHRGGAITRGQAHGSPANLLDIYAAVDIPECEGFGLSDFGIRGLRTDTAHTKKNDSDISMLKYASSAAHVANKTFTSSETFTWLTEHFRTSLSQCKPDLDLMFIAGVNHVVFHGSCYSPVDEPWPGWRFYASVDMTPYNPQWNAMPEFCRYISRCQSFLQWGQPDNDFLVYLPYYDMIAEQPGRLALFDIHSMAKRAPRFISAIQTIVQRGYDVDYISDRYLQTDAYKRYDAVIVPDVRFMPVSSLQRLIEIAKDGKRIIFVGHYPEHAPGRSRAGEQAQFDATLRKLRQHATLATTYEDALERAGGRLEPMRLATHLSCIRRSNPDGHHYFISNLTPNDVDDYIGLGVSFASAEFYNPLTGAVTRPDVRGKSLRLQLRSGESIILRTYREKTDSEADAHPYHNSPIATLTPTNWELTFPRMLNPDVADELTNAHISMDAPQSWTTYGGAFAEAMATGCYAADFVAPQTEDDSLRYTIDLGDVRESARIVVNGTDVATLFSVPFRCDITKAVRPGNNRIEVYVTNLPANRIARMDRDSVPWRHFKDANVVDLNYKRTLYDTWEPVPSGLCSPVSIAVERHF